MITNRHDLHTTQQLPLRCDITITLKKLTSQDYCCNVRLQCAVVNVCIILTIPDSNNIINYYNNKCVSETQTRHTGAGS